MGDRMAEPTKDELLEAIGELYQVVGILADRAGLFENDQVMKILDWLSKPDGKLDVLPFILPDDVPPS